MTAKNPKADQKTKKITIGTKSLIGLFHLKWARKRLPDPGAQNYAFESLGLVQFPVSGPSIYVRDHKNPLSGPQPYVGQAVPLAGVPTVAGQIISQPLFDPANGYTAPLASIMNEPFSPQLMTAAGRAI